MSIPDEILTLDPDCYSVESVKAAIYKFSDRFSATVDVDAGAAVVSMYFEDGVAERPKVLSEFRKELIDQSLRERIRNETAAVRGLVLAHAYSRTNLASDE